MCGSMQHMLALDVHVDDVACLSSEHQASFLNSAYDMRYSDTVF
jgi:hypothetical protein